LLARCLSPMWAIYSEAQLFYRCLLCLQFLLMPFLPANKTPPNSHSTISLMYLSINITKREHMWSLGSIPWWTTTTSYPSSSFLRNKSSPAKPWKPANWSPIRETPSLKRLNLLKPLSFFFKKRGFACRRCILFSLP